MTAMKRPANMSRIRSFFERWERLETSRRELSDDLKELFSEAKSEGFNSKALRVAFAEKFRLENEDHGKAEKREMDEADADLYLAALAGPSHACEASQSYVEWKGVGTVRLTGEITEQEQPGEPAHQSQSVHEARSMPAESMGDEISERVGLAGPACAQDAETANTKPAPVSPSAAPAVEPEAAPQAPQSASGEVSDADVPAFLKRDRYVLRPHCLNPSLCAGSGSKHCHACLKARDESILADEVAA